MHRSVVDVQVLVVLKSCLFIIIGGLAPKPPYLHTGLRPMAYSPAGWVQAFGLAMEGTACYRRLSATITDTKAS